MTNNNFYWTKYTNGDGMWKFPSLRFIPGEEIAALRHGLGKTPGSVPSMWPFYSTFNNRGDLTPQIIAEHHCLCIFAIHQQSKDYPVHQNNISFGKAIKALSHSDQYREAPEAINKRFSAAATSTSLDELVNHMRHLITQLRSIRQPLDYTYLYFDLLRWQKGEHKDVIRPWGIQYFSSNKSAPKNA